MSRFYLPSDDYDDWKEMQVMNTPSDRRNAAALADRKAFSSSLSAERTPAAAAGDDTAAAGDDTAAAGTGISARDANTLTVSAVDFYNTAMLKIFGVTTGQQIFGHVDDFNPMYLPDSVAKGNDNIKRLEARRDFYSLRYSEEQLRDVKKRPEKFEKYIAFLKTNGFFDFGKERGVGLLSGLAEHMLYYDNGATVDMFKEFIQNMEIQKTGNNIEVTLRDIVSMSTSVKSKPYYCDSVKLFIAVLTAVKHINLMIRKLTTADTNSHSVVDQFKISLTFKFSNPGVLQKLSGLQKSFVTCSPTAVVPTGDPVATNYFKFNINDLTVLTTSAASAASAAAGGGRACVLREQQQRQAELRGSKLMRRNRRHRNRKHTRKTRRGRGRSHKRASKSHKRA